MVFKVPDLLFFLPQEDNILKENNDIDEDINIKLKHFNRKLIYTKYFAIITLG